MSYEVFLEKRAKDQLEKLSTDTSERIKEKLGILRKGFLPELDIKKLEGYKNCYRLRIGDYRALFELEGNRIVVYAILPRRKAYR